MRKLIQNKDKVNESFFQISQNMFSDMIGTFKKKASDLILENSGWGEQYIIHEKELE